MRPAAFFACVRPSADISPRVQSWACQCSSGRPSIRDDRPTIAEIDDQIATARDNIRELIEQAAAFSPAAEDDLVAQRAAVQKDILALRTKRRGERFRRRQ